MVDLDKLTRAFPREAIRTRQGGGSKPLAYVPTHTIIHRLNDATGNQWDWHIIKLEWRVVQTGNGPVDELMCYGELTIPSHGTRAGIGVQRVSERGGEDLVKGASSDALKKAATLFGVALELYGADVEGDDVGQSQDASQGNGRAYSGDTHYSNPNPSRQTRDAAPGNQEATPRQIKYLHAVAREAGISNDDLEQRSRDAFGEELANLGRRDVSALIEQIQAERAEALPS